MLPEHRKKTLLFFLFIYALFGLILIYLLLFNIGLEIVERLDPSTGGKSVFVKNGSSRTIYNISGSYVENGEKKEILSIWELKSGQEKEITYDFPAELRVVELIVEAPYHQSVSKGILLGFGRTGLSYNFRVPQRIFKDVQFPFVLEICNDTNITKDALVEERHDQSFIEDELSIKSVTIAAWDCDDLEYLFTPKKVGLTAINFNIKVQNIMDKRGMPITVEE